MAFLASTIAELDSSATDLANGSQSLLRHVTDIKTFIIYVLVLEANSLTTGNSQPNLGFLSVSAASDISGYNQ